MMKETNQYFLAFNILIMTFTWKVNYLLYCRTWGLTVQTRQRRDMTFYAFSRHFDAKFPSKKMFLSLCTWLSWGYYAFTEIRPSLLLPSEGAMVAAGVLEHCFPENLSFNILKDCQALVTADCYYLFWLEINAKALHLIWQVLWTE